MNIKAQKLIIEPVRDYEIFLQQIIDKKDICAYVKERTPWSLTLEHTAEVFSAEELLEMTPPNTELTLLLADSGRNFVSITSINMPDRILCVPEDEIITYETGESAWEYAKELGFKTDLEELFEEC